MKTLTSSQKQALDRSRLKLTYLLEITLQGAGAPTLYLSDRNITVGGQVYENYLLDLSGLEEEIERATSEGLNPDINLKFKNDRYKIHNHLIEIGDIYPFEGAATTIKEVYLDDDNAPSDPATIFKGALDELQRADELNFEYSVSGILQVKDEQFKQSLITEQEFPNAIPADINKYQNIIYGSCPQVKCHLINAGGISNLTADITDVSPGNGGTLELSDASRFPSSGAFTILIDQEQIRIASRSGNTLTLAASGARAYEGTTAAAHDKGTEVFNLIIRYVYLVARHAVKSIGDIYYEENDVLVRYTSSGVTKYTGQSGNEHPSYPGKAVIEFTVEARKTITPTNVDVEQQTVTNPQNLYDGNCADYATFSGSAIARVYFSTTNYGTILTQYCYICMPGGGDNFNIEGGWTPTTLSSTAGTYTFTKSGGDWGDTVRILASGNTGYVGEVERKEIFYIPAPTETEAANITKPIDVTKPVYCDVEGYQDDASGTYTGVANALIERPDHVISHFINVLYGFALTDINTASFNAAGALYTTAISGGYKFAFVINEENTPSEFVQNLAFQCRSNIKYETGKWYLNYLPDTSPAAVQTVKKSELAGEFTKFKFGKTLRVDIVNDLTAKFQKNYGGLAYDESEWLGTSVVSDATSQGKYGVMLKEFEFWAIRLQTMADHVLAHVLLEKKNPLLIIEFPIFWEHFNLERGDTFDIENDLYNGKKFYIEKVGKPSKGKMEITGIEWPPT